MGGNPGWRLRLLVHRCTLKHLCLFGVGLVSVEIKFNEERTFEN